LSFNGSPINADAFVAKVKADGTGLVYAGYIGGNGDDVGDGIAVDGTGNAYVIGATYSTEATFPVSVGPDPSYNGGGYDAFVAEVKADGTGLVYAGYIGGNRAERGRGIAVDGAGNAYVTGSTYSTEATFPVAVGPDLSFNGPSGDQDAFVAKIGSPGPCLTMALAIAGLKVLKQLANLDNIDFTWDPDPAANGYNIWYVLLKADIPKARQASAPPALPVTGCAFPSPAIGNACTDVGAVSRNAPSSFFYQVHTYCDAASEGP
jgi:hypothetical protein